MPDDAPLVLYEPAPDARMVTITVNRPDKRNALDASVLSAIDAAFERAREDAACGVVVLTGAGDRAFVAGADIGELVRLDVAGAKAQARRGQATLSRIERLGKPVIAMINGFAFGGGLEIALACHLRTMADTAKVGLPEVGLGIFPGYGGTQRLPRIVGRGRALEIILSGEAVDARTAHAIGLANRVAPAAELRSVTEALAKTLLSRGPLALAFALESVLRGTDLPLEEGLQVEADLFGLAASTEDMREGLQAFLAKRPPAFRGR